MSYSYDSLAYSAIGEIDRQLSQQGGTGSVWVDEWKEWYQRDLGTLREFLESRPDRYRVVPEGDRKYHVEFVRGGRGKGWEGAGKGTATRTSASGFVSGPQGMGFGWGQGGGYWSKTTADAIIEIKAQLREQGGHGKVWVDKWPTRFQPELGTLRQFLEARSDKFEVHPGKGASFTVSLLGFSVQGKDKGSKGKSAEGKGSKGNDRGKAKGKAEGKSEEGKGSKVRDHKPAAPAGSKKQSQSGKRWYVKDQTDDADAKEEDELSGEAARGDPFEDKAEESESSD